MGEHIYSVRRAFIYRSVSSVPSVLKIFSAGVVNNSAFHLKPLIFLRFPPIYTQKKYFWEGEGSDSLCPTPYATIFTLSRPSGQCTAR